MKQILNKEKAVDTFIKVVGVCVIAVMAAVLISFLLAWPLMWCWNYIMPDLFGFKTITWFQAWVIGALTGMLFKSSYTQKSND